jgi:hypothetical protein
MERFGRGAVENLGFEIGCEGGTKVTGLRRKGSDLRAVRK